MIKKLALITFLLFLTAGNAFSRMPLVQSWKADEKPFNLQKFFTVNHTKIFDAANGAVGRYDIKITARRTTYGREEPVYCVCVFETDQTFDQKCTFSKDDKLLVAKKGDWLADRRNRFKSSINYSKHWDLATRTYITRDSKNYSSWYWNFDGDFLVEDDEHKWSPICDDKPISILCEE